MRDARTAQLDMVFIHHEHQASRPTRPSPSFPTSPASTCMTFCCRCRCAHHQHRSMEGMREGIGRAPGRTSRSGASVAGNIAGTPSASRAACCLVTRPSHAGSTRSRSNLSSSERNESVNACGTRVHYQIRTSEGTRNMDGLGEHQLRIVSGQPQ